MTGLVPGMLLLLLCCLLGGLNASGDEDCEQAIEVSIKGDEGEVGAHDPAQPQVVQVRSKRSDVRFCRISIGITFPDLAAAVSQLDQNADESDGLVDVLPSGLEAQFECKHGKPASSFTIDWLSPPGFEGEVRLWTLVHLWGAELEEAKARRLCSYSSFTLRARPTVATEDRSRLEHRPSLPSPRLFNRRAAEEKARDEARLLQTGAVSPTPSETAYPTETSSITSTGTATMTHTTGVSASITATATETSSASVTAEPTQSETVSPGYSFSNTETITSTESASETSSSTASLSESLSFTATTSEAATASVSQGLSASISPTYTPSQSTTASNTPTISLTPTASISLGLSASATTTETSSQSGSSSATFSDSPTNTRTVSETTSGTRTSSASLSNTRSSTETPSSTRSASGTPSRGFVPSITPSRSESGSITASSSSSATMTASKTATGSGVPTATGTVTASRSVGASYSRSPTSSRSSSSSPLPSSSSSGSESATVTISPSETLSGSYTPTETVSATFGSTPSVSPAASLSATPTSTPVFATSTPLFYGPAGTGKDPSTLAGGATVLSWRLDNWPSGDPALATKVSFQIVSPGDVWIGLARSEDGSMLNQPGSKGSGPAVIGRSDQGGFTVTQYQLLSKALDASGIVPVPPDKVTINTADGSSYVYYSPVLQATVFGFTRALIPPDYALETEKSIDVFVPQTFIVAKGDPNGPFGYHGISNRKAFSLVLAPPLCTRSGQCTDHGDCKGPFNVPTCFCDIGFSGSDCGSCAPGFARTADGGCAAAPPSPTVVDAVVASTTLLLSAPFGSIVGWGSAFMQSAKYRRFVQGLTAEIAAAAASTSPGASMEAITARINITSLLPATATANPLPYSTRYAGSPAFYQGQDGGTLVSFSFLPPGAVTPMLASSSSSALNPPTATLAAAFAGKASSAGGFGAASAFATTSYLRFLNSSLLPVAFNLTNVIDVALSGGANFPAAGGAFPPRPPVYVVKAQLPTASAELGNLTLEWGLTSIDSPYAPAGKNVPAIAFRLTLTRGAQSPPPSWLLLSFSNASIPSMLGSDAILFQPGGGVASFSQYVITQHSLAGMREVMWDQGLQMPMVSGGGGPVLSFAPNDAPPPMPAAASIRRQRRLQRSATTGNSAMVPPTPSAFLYDWASEGGLNTTFVEWVRPLQPSALFDGLSTVAADASAMPCYLSYAVPINISVPIGLFYSVGSGPFLTTAGGWHHPGLSGGVLLHLRSGRVRPLPAVTPSSITQERAHIYALKQAHGALMFLAWAIFLPAAILVSLHLRRGAKEPPVVLTGSAAGGRRSSRPSSVLANATDSASDASNSNSEGKKARPGSIHASMNPFAAVVSASGSSSSSNKSSIAATNSTATRAGCSLTDCCWNFTARWSALPFWLRLHAGLQLTSTLLAFCGFVIGASLVNQQAALNNEQIAALQAAAADPDTAASTAAASAAAAALDEASAPVPGFVMAHRVIGVMLWLAGLAQLVIAAFFRPEPHSQTAKAEDVKRRRWETCHRWSGYALLVLSIVQIYLGLNAIQASDALFVLYSLFLAVSIYAFFFGLVNALILGCLVRTMSSCCCTKDASALLASLAANDYSEAAADEQEEEEEGAEGEDVPSQHDGGDDDGEREEVVVVRRDSALHGAIAVAAATVAGQRQQYRYEDEDEEDDHEGEDEDELHRPSAQYQVRSSIYNRTGGFREEAEYEEEEEEDEEGSPRLQLRPSAAVTPALLATRRESSKPALPPRSMVRKAPPPAVPKRLGDAAPQGPPPPAPKRFVRTVFTEEDAPGGVSFAPVPAQPSAAAGKLEGVISGTAVANPLAAVSAVAAASPTTTVAAVAGPTTTTRRVQDNLTRASGFAGSGAAGGNRFGPTKVANRGRPAAGSSSRGRGGGGGAPPSTNSRLARDPAMLSSSQAAVSANPLRAATSGALADLEEVLEEQWDEDDFEEGPYGRGGDDYRGEEEEEEEEEEQTSK